VNDYRIEEARRLLRESELPVLDIALEVGSNTKSTFNASLKRITGQTPTVYRDAQARSKQREKDPQGYESRELDDSSCTTR